MSPYPVARLSLTLVLTMTIAGCSSDLGRRVATPARPTSVALMPLDDQPATTPVIDDGSSSPDTAARPPVTGRTGGEYDIALPEDPCTLVAVADIEAELGVTGMNAVAMGDGYGCLYSRVPTADQMDSGQTAPVTQLLLVAEGDAAKRQELDAYAQLLTHPGCRSSGSAGAVATATPFPAEVEAMMSLSLAEIFKTRAGLFATRCVMDAALASDGGGGGLGTFGFRSYRQFEGLGDAAAYGDAVIFSTVASHNLFVVAGDKLITLQVMGKPEFDADGKSAFASEVSLMQRILGVPPVQLDVVVPSLAPLPTRAVVVRPTLPVGARRLYQAQFDDIDSGMTIVQVSALLGFEGKDGPFTTSETWVWQEGKGQIRLSVEGGVHRGGAVMMNVTDPDLKAKFSQIEDGMPSAEIERILGPASEKEVSQQQTVVWTDDAGSQLSVTFADGISGSGKSWTSKEP